MHVVAVTTLMPRPQKRLLNFNEINDARDEANHNGNDDDRVEGSFSPGGASITLVT